MSAPDTGAPNLDAMPRSELVAWAKQTPHVLAAKLFPAKPRGYMQAACDLLIYADTKSAAMGFREDGEIDKALELEAYCDRVYQRLPAFARW